jgi:hypothetical protein
VRKRVDAVVDPLHRPAEACGGSLRVEPLNAGRLLPSARQRERPELVRTELALAEIQDGVFAHLGLF